MEKNMNEIDKTEMNRLNGAIKTLRDYCNSHDLCNGCVLKTDDDSLYDCKLFASSPAQFKDVGEELLTYKEKQFLQYLIDHVRPRITKIEKRKYETDSEYKNKEYIALICEEKSCGKIELCETLLPDFIKGTMYKGMELNKEYTIGDLGLVAKE